MTRAPITLVVVLVAGCYDAPKPDCGFRCGPSAACPADYTCASDNRCHRNGSSPDLVCATPDAMPPDAYSPRVVFSAPAANAMNVPTSQPIEVGFDVDVAGVSSTTFTVTITSTTTPVIGMISYVPSTHRATFTRAGGLPPNAELLVELTQDIFDPVGNRPLMPTSYTFRTGADTTRPTVTATNPTNGATGASVATTVSFMFSEDILVFSGMPVRLLDGGSPVTGTSTYASGIRTGFFDPQDQLLPNHTYTAQAESTIADVAGNMIVPFSMMFTTGADAVAPNVRTSTPMSADTNVAVTSNVVVTFDEPVMNVDTTSFRLNAGAIAGTVMASNGNKTWTFDPTSDLPAASTITVSLSAAITDTSANALSATQFSFTTM